METAYLILVHRYPQQFKRLFRAIYTPANHYLIHVDKRSGLGLQAEIRDFLSGYSNAHLLGSQTVVWGGYSMVDVELRGIKELLKISAEWDCFINLSGQDFPLKPQAFIQEFLSRNKGKDFLLIADQAKKRPHTMNRVQNYFVENDHGFSGIPYKRPYLRDVTPYIGGQWMVLSRECCEFMSRSSKMERFKSFYQHTLIPDEGIKLLVKTLRAKDTESLIASGRIKLRPKTFTANDTEFLLASDALFARKFDMTVDSTIFDILESKLQIANYTLSNKRSQPIALRAIR